MGERFGDAASDLRRVLDQHREIPLGDDQNADVARRRHRCGAGHLRDERDLPEEIALLHRVDSAVALRHVGLTREEDEELASTVAFRRHLLAARKIELIGNPSNLLEALLRQAREERHLLNQLDLAVLSEAHVTTLRGRWLLGKLEAPKNQGLTPGCRESVTSHPQVRAALFSRRAAGAARIAGSRRAADTPAPAGYPGEPAPETPCRRRAPWPRVPPRSPCPRSRTPRDPRGPASRGSRRPGIAAGRCPSSAGWSGGCAHTTLRLQRAPRADWAPWLPSPGTSRTRTPSLRARSREFPPRDSAPRPRRSSSPRRSERAPSRCPLPPARGDSSAARSQTSRAPSPRGCRAVIRRS